MAPFASLLFGVEKSLSFIELARGDFQGVAAPAVAGARDRRPIGLLQKRSAHLPRSQELLRRR